MYAVNIDIIFSLDGNGASIQDAISCFWDLKKSLAVTPDSAVWASCLTSSFFICQLDILWHTMSKSEHVFQIDLQGKSVYMSVMQIAIICRMTLDENNYRRQHMHDIHCISFSTSMSLHQFNFTNGNKYRTPINNLHLMKFTMVWHKRGVSDVQHKMSCM